MTLLLLVTSCASPSKNESLDQTERIIDAGFYSVRPPAEKGWQIRVDREKGVVKFDRPGKTITGGPTLTSILVFLNGVTPEAGPRTEQQAADEARALEEQSLKSGATRGEYKLGPVQKGVVTIGDKKLYTMSYKTTKGLVFPNLGPATGLEAELYLYFPPDFATSRRFFSILITEAYQRGAFASVDFTQVEPVIRSLELRKEFHETR